MNFIIFLFISLELLIVSYLDIKTKKIRNFWPVLNLGLYLALMFILPVDYGFNFKTLFVPVTFLIVGFILFLFKIMGAGDTKFLFSLFFLIPPTLHENVFELLLYATILVGIVLLSIKVLSNYKDILFNIRIGNKDFFNKIWGSKFPYSPVVLITWIVFGISQREVFVF